MNPIAQLEWQAVQNPYPASELLAPAAIEKLHDASMRILAEIGVDFLLPDARDILRKAGADISGERVRFDPEMIAHYLTTAPQSFTLHARNPEHNLTIGGRYINFGSVASAPNVSDLEQGRRPGNFNDFADLLRLCQQLNTIHFLSGYPVEPVDLPPATRHLDCLRALITLTDKVYHAYSLGAERIADALAMTQIARGIDTQQLRREPSLMTVINSSSPLRIDAPMLAGMIEMARHGQAIVMTPFTLAGAMAPVTLAGALAQQNAEALAGIVFAQIVNPGTPVVYGGFTSNVDMKSGAPAFGTPEYSRAAQIGGQLARYYQLPYRSSNANAANAVDAQAAYESQMSLWGAVTGHANMVLHGAGWLEGGLTASFEKVIVDAECLQMLTEYLKPVTVDEGSLAFEAISEVGPGGHFFGAQHTLERFETVFYTPLVSDWRNFESWQHAGSVDTARRANQLVKQFIAAYSPPPLAQDKREALDEFVAKRRAEGGVKSD